MEAAAARVAQILAPDANLLYGGNEPNSYAAVIASFEMAMMRECYYAGGLYTGMGLFEQYADNPDTRPTIKAALRPLGAHLNRFARGAVPNADISVTEFFRKLNDAARRAMKAMTKGQHDKAVELGLARTLDLPKDTKKGKLKQDSCMPFLKKHACLREEDLDRRPARRRAQRPPRSRRGARHDDALRGRVHQRDAQD